MNNKELIKNIKTTEAIRHQCEKVLKLSEKDKLSAFSYNPEKLHLAVDFVGELIKENYPDYNVPYHSRWRHFDDRRLNDLDKKMKDFDEKDKAKTRIELAIVSVLLDAGAGMKWRYKDEKGEVTKMSEGLAAASFDMFMKGDFSYYKNKSKLIFRNSSPNWSIPRTTDNEKLRADASALKNLSENSLKKSLQVSDENPLNGFEGRLSLLRKLGDAVASKKEVFGSSDQRLGNILDYILLKEKNGEVSALDILDSVLHGLGSIWPGRISIDGHNLGDVWTLPYMEKDEKYGGLIPFHKLSQWLSYSLVEPIEWMGIKVTDVDKMTGLAEYRNGGLFVDLGIIVPKDKSIIENAHAPGSEVIVEWRALTVCLLDKVADGIRSSLGKSPEDLPLAKVLQGGTWLAGRRLAAGKRSDGGPPIKIKSDGTVF